MGFWKKRYALRIFLSLCATSALIYAVVTQIPRADLMSAFRSYRANDLINYALLSLFALLVRAARYQIMLRAMLNGKHIPTFWQLVVTSGIRNAFVDFLPARLGEVTYVMVLKRYGVDVVSAVSSFALCLALDIVVLFGILLSLFLIFVVAEPFLPETLQTVESMITAGQSSVDRKTIMTALTCILLLLIWGLWRAPQIVDFARRVTSRVFQFLPAFLSGRKSVRRFVGKVDQLLTRIAGELESVVRSGYYGRLIVATLCLRFAKYGSLYLLLLGVLQVMAVGVRWISPFTAFAAFLSAEASASLPISGIMGFGTYEAVWTFVLHVSNINLRPGLIAAIGLSIHIVTQIFSYIIGVLCLLIAASNREAGLPTAVPK